MSTLTIVSDLLSEHSFPMTNTIARPAWSVYYAAIDISHSPIFPSCNKCQSYIWRLSIHHAPYTRTIGLIATNYPHSLVF
jgi:hypothetical protein